MHGGGQNPYKRRSTGREVQGDGTGYGSRSGEREFLRYEIIGGTCRFRKVQEKRNGIG
jgi:hypothetical protein